MAFAEPESRRCHGVFTDNIQEESGRGAQGAERTLTQILKKRESLFLEE